jgi:hypothetical protein
MARGGAKLWRVAGDQPIPAGEDRRREVIIAFLGVGLSQSPSRAQAVAALAAARREVASCLALRASVREWLAGEVRFHGIRENAAVLVVLEIPDLARRLHTFSLRIILTVSRNSRTFSLSSPESGIRSCRSW